MAQQKQEDFLGDRAVRLCPGFFVTLNVGLSEKVDIPISHVSSTSLTA